MLCCIYARQRSAFETVLAASRKVWPRGALHDPRQKSRGNAALDDLLSESWPFTGA